MTVYYIKQDNTSWCCEEDSGPYYEEIEEIFHVCECEKVIPDDEPDMALHLQTCLGGGPILKWREATKREALAYVDGKSDGYSEGHYDGAEWQKQQDARRAEAADKAKTDPQRSVHELVHLGYKVTVDGTKLGKSINHYSEYSDEVILETPYYYDVAEGFSLQIKNTNEDNTYSFGSIKQEYFLVVGEEEVAITPTIAYGIAKSVDAFKNKYRSNNDPTLF